MLRVAIKPELFQWALQRAGFTSKDLERRFPKLESWRYGEARPTLKQLEDFAKATFVPIGYFFLTEPPPVESLPFADFRAGYQNKSLQLSPHLIDTVQICQERQNWYADFCRSSGESPLLFVGSVTPDAVVEDVAEDIRQKTNFQVEDREECDSWSEALQKFIANTENLGVLVMRSGIVLNNTHRKLDPAEFRGFAIADSLAPLIFINGADSKAAQMFTLAHELAHLWIGQSALSDASIATTPNHDTEGWCNRVAAEFLVPRSQIEKQKIAAGNLGSEVKRLARAYKVSTIVVLRRLYDVGIIPRQKFIQGLNEELEDINAKRKKSGGGDFYQTELARVGRRFAQALYASTLEGNTLYRDAFRMFGISKTETFEQIGRHLESSFA